MKQWFASILASIRRVVFRRARRTPLALPPAAPDTTVVQETSPVDPVPPSPAHSSRSETQGRRVHKKSKASFGSRVKNKWVKRLLHPTENVKDKIYHKKPVLVSNFPLLDGSPLQVLLTTDKVAYRQVLAHILSFLPTKDVATNCALVSKRAAVAVKRYYTIDCVIPRPKHYLVHQLFQLPHHAFQRRVMSMLDQRERLLLGTCSKSLLDACNRSPLQLSGPHQVPKWLNRLTVDRMSERYQRTRVLEIDSIPKDHLGLVLDQLDTMQYICEDSNEIIFQELKFESLQDIPLHAFRSLAKLLFSDSISQQLETLTLERIHLEDEHFRLLAKVWKDKQFPKLESINLAYNPFSSRFMRDWAVSLALDSFIQLKSLDIRGTLMSEEDLERFICLLHKLPQLEKLSMSDNYCPGESVHLLTKTLKSKALSHLRYFDCRAITNDSTAMGFLLEALRSTPELRTLDISGNPLDTVLSQRKLQETIASEPWLHMERLFLSNMELGKAGVKAFGLSLLSHPMPHLEHLDISENGAGESIEAFIKCMRAGSCRKLLHLNLSGNDLGAMEFQLLSDVITSSHVPRLQELYLSDNNAGTQGAIRIATILCSRAGGVLYELDVSHNGIAEQGLYKIAETLRKGACDHLMTLNLSGNLRVNSMTPFQDVIRDRCCASLVSIQVGYAQSYREGRAFVQKTRSTTSIEELRQKRQAHFDSTLHRYQNQATERASQDVSRCKTQCQHLRAKYDALENEAKTALRQRKKSRKSSHLYIHHEIAQMQMQVNHARRFPTKV